MSQPSKKSPAQPAAKLASDVADRAARQTFAAVESSRNSAENVVRLGSSAVREFLSTSADEAQKAQEKMFSFGREGAENLTKSADAISKMMYEAVAMSRENVETCIECGNMAASLAQDVSAELFESANKAFSDNVDLSKELFACRTVNDMVDLQNRAIRQSIDGFFNQSMKFSGLLFEYSSEALEPLGERVVQITEHLNKAVAA